MDGVSGLLLTGGGDVDPALYGEALDGSMGIEPERDEMEMALFRYAIEEDMPTLGICRGMQLINVAMGGRLIQGPAGAHAAGVPVGGAPGVRVAGEPVRGHHRRGGDLPHEQPSSPGAEGGAARAVADGVGLSPGRRHRGGAGEPGASMGLSGCSATLSARTRCRRASASCSSGSPDGQSGTKQETCRDETAKRSTAAAGGRVRRVPAPLPGPARPSACTAGCSSGSRGRRSGATS